MKYLVYFATLLLSNAKIPAHTRIKENKEKYVVRKNSCHNFLHQNGSERSLQVKLLIAMEYDFLNCFN